MKQEQAISCVVRPILIITDNKYTIITITYGTQILRHYYLLNAENIYSMQICHHNVTEYSRPLAVCQPVAKLIENSGIFQKRHP